MLQFFKQGLKSLAVVALTAAPALAEDLPSPVGEIVLTASGGISVTNAGETAVFDIEMLRTVGEVTFSTTTPWTEGVQTFTGVPLDALMKTLGVTEGTLKATAVNDYAVDIPVADAVEGGPILAYLQNGEPMSVREKGPLWVVYPYDSRNEYQAEVVFSRSIWQLTKLEVMGD